MFMFKWAGYLRNFVRLRKRGSNIGKFNLNVFSGNPALRTFLQALRQVRRGLHRESSFGGDGGAETVFGRFGAISLIPILTLSDPWLSSRGVRWT